ncbi:MAG: hypothetical protein PHT69_14855 [Bacteroidales bacterium]|nr:hypothetical protein [Bacteroidales bacterium]
MKKKVLFGSLLLISGVIIFLEACKKDNDTQGDTIPLVFSDLKAENDTIYAGTSTSITATATGKDLIYMWSASAGDILGSGNTVTYASPPCVPGINEVSCTVKDNINNTQTKTINIVVL